MILCYGVLPAGIALGDTVRVIFANGETEVGKADEFNWRHVSDRRRDAGYNIVSCEIVSRYTDDPAASKQGGA